MPTYEYRCPDGHTFEVLQSMSEEPVKVCEVCGKPVERVLHPVAVHFKGSGFYTTDYARKGSKASSDGSKDSSKDAAKNGSAKAEPASSSSGEAKSGTSSD